MNDILLGLVVCSGLLLWSLTWFGARGWDFDGRHGVNAIFGTIMVLSGMGVLCYGSIVFLEGVFALSRQG